MGRFLGIDLHLHLTFLLMLAFIGVSHWAAHGSFAAVATGVGLFLAIFACVMLHEYGHALAARSFGIGTRDITLLPIGGVARLERMPEKPMQELWITLAGPAVNVAIAIVLALWLTFSRSWEPLGALSATNGAFLERLLAVNVFLVLFNLLPAFPMDGGRVLRALLALRMEYVRATRFAAWVGQALAVGLGVIGFFSNPMLLLVAIFVWFGAAQEAGSAEAKAMLGGLPVREAMVTEFRVLSAGDSLGEASRLLLAGSQQDFPVLSEGRLVGVLSQITLFTALRERGPHTLVGEVMEREFRAFSPEELLEESVLEAAPAGPLMPVLSDGRLVGLLTGENIRELLMIRSALGAARN